MLRELQRAVAAAVYDEQPGAEQHVQPGKFSAAQHLQVYRNNVIVNLTTALADVYPVVEKLVGSGFFKYAAYEYLRHHRPVSANLHDFGHAFAAFLTDFAAAQSLAYLPDVARLEWAWHRALHAADAEPLDASAFAAVPPEHGETLRLVPHPGATVVQSNYPVVQIFEIHQSGAIDAAAVDLTARGESALVIRRGLQVVVEPLGAGTAAWLAALSRNETLAQALDAALGAQPDFDLHAALADHLQRGSFVRLLWL